jgi:hypothetical protein
MATKLTKKQSIYSITMESQTDYSNIDNHKNIRSLIFYIDVFISSKFVHYIIGFGFTLLLLWFHYLHVGICYGFHFGARRMLLGVERVSPNP